MNNTYNHTLECRDCGHRGRFLIPLKKTVAQYLAAASCPSCGDGDMIDAEL